MMPGAFIKSFDRSGVTYAWKWIDTEGNVILNWIRDRVATPLRQDYQVDRSGSKPVLRWQRYAWVHNPETMTGAYQPTGQWGSLTLDEAEYYYGEYAGSDDFAVRPLTELPTGWWISDRYGRPYDLNDLLAE
jgi:hypothetical protein